MKNLETRLHYAAAILFLLGLMANVSLSLTDPFIFVDTDMLAQASGNGSSSSSSGDGSCSACVDVTLGALGRLGKASGVEEVADNASYKTKINVLGFDGKSIKGLSIEAEQHSGKNIGIMSGCVDTGWFCDNNYIRYTPF